MSGGHGQRTYICGADSTAGNELLDFESLGRCHAFGLGASPFVNVNERGRVGTGRQVEV